MLIHKFLVDSEKTEKQFRKTQATTIIVVPCNSIIDQFVSLLMWLTVALPLKRYTADTSKTNFSISI